MLTVSRESMSGLAPRALATGFLACLILGGCGGGTTGPPDGPPPPPPNITIKSVCAFYQGNASAPCYAIAGQGAFQLLLNGTGFTSSSVVEWNGNPLPTTFGDSTDLVGAVSRGLIGAPGKATITVTDSGATSNALELQIASSATLTAGVIQLVSAAQDGSPADTFAGVPAISATGRYVTFVSNATGLAPGPASSYNLVYERDTCLGAANGCIPTTIVVTVAYDGSPVNGNSETTAVSANGRYVVFDTLATNILPGSSVCALVPAPGDCVFLRDTCTGAPSGCAPSTFPISVNTQGQIAPGSGPQMSQDARFIVFTSNESFLGLGSATVGDMFRRDTCLGAPPGCVPNTAQVSYTSDGGQGNNGSGQGGISANGRFAAFLSHAGNMVPDEINGPGIFWRDTCLGAGPGCTPATLRSDVSNGGAQPTGTVPYALLDFFVPVTADGRLVAFASGATNLVATDVNAGCGLSAGGIQGTCDGIYIRDTCAGAATGCTPSTSLVSLANDGSTANCGDSGNLGGLTMSADGRLVAFGSIGTNLSPDDTFPACGWEDIFVRDTCFGVASGCTPSTVRVSVANPSPYPGVSSDAPNAFSAISADGHYVVFVSSATNLLPGTPTNGHAMVYLAKTGF